jgi:hypothetical protein
MPCLFGFHFHESLCPCDLVIPIILDLHGFVCSRCEDQIRSDYKVMLSSMKDDGVIPDFDFFLAFFIGERLRELASIEKCVHGLTFDGHEKTVQRLIDVFNKTVEQKGLQLMREQPEQEYEYLN